MILTITLTGPATIYPHHCGTPPVPEHPANGMSGAVIIHPPDLAPVQREFLVVQSELYLGPQRQPGDYAKMLRGQPDAVGAPADTTPLTSAQPAQPAGRVEQLPGTPGAEEHHPHGEVQREPAAAE